MKFTGINSNVYMNIIFIVMGANTTVYTGKYPESLLILRNNRNFFGVTMNYLNPLFLCNIVEIL